MKRKKMKKGISIALSAAMAAGMLSGCGGGSNSSSTASTSGESDVPTYTIATVRWTDTWPTDFLESGIMKELEERMEFILNGRFITILIGQNRNPFCLRQEICRMRSLALFH